ncbi:hypothetical protein ABZ801_00760 [Actinomadura sp. NPDC047616]|uniref:hypothetical protein n=1 Tax=Actinomadura sp. NPDC047616 TaxID=3155914 RepID=UPI0033E5053E
MSKDMVALLKTAPDEESVEAALAAAGPEVWVSDVGDGGALKISDREGGQVVALVEAPILVQVPGELERLLGPEVAHLEPPIWWVEVHASEEVENAEVPALRFAAELSLRLDGEVWLDDPAYADRAGLRSR